MGKTKLNVYLFKEKIKTIKNRKFLLVIDNAKQKFFLFQSRQTEIESVRERETFSGTISFWHNSHYKSQNNDDDVSFN